MKSILKFGALSLLTVAIAAAPTQLQAQSTNKHASGKTSTAASSETAATAKKAHPFHGKLSAVDKTAKTVKVGETTYQVTSTTKITKDGKPATLEDAVIGEQTTGYAKPSTTGTMTATSLNLSPKPSKH